MIVASLFDDEFAQIFVTSPRALPAEGPYAQMITTERAIPVLSLPAPGGDDGAEADEPSESLEAHEASA